VTAASRSSSRSLRPRPIDTARAEADDVTVRRYGMWIAFWIALGGVALIQGGWDAWLVAVVPFGVALFIGACVLLDKWNERRRLAESRRQLLLSMNERLRRLESTQERQP